jgi:hypothetical protein
MTTPRGTRQMSIYDNVKTSIYDSVKTSIYDKV